MYITDQVKLKISRIFYVTLFMDACWNTAVVIFFINFICSLSFEIDIECEQHRIQTTYRFFFIVFMYLIEFYIDSFLVFGSLTNSHVFSNVSIQCNWKKNKLNNDLKKHNLIFMSNGCEEKIAWVEFCWHLYFPHCIFLNFTSHYGNYWMVQLWRQKFVFVFVVHNRKHENSTYHHFLCWKTNFF